MRHSRWLIAPVVAACGGSTAVGGGDGAGSEIGECRVQERWALVESETESEVLDLAVRRDEVGMIWWAHGNPQRLLFASFAIDAPRIDHPVELDGVAASSPPAGLTAFADGFVAVWVDFDGCQPGDGCGWPTWYSGRLHVTRLVAGGVASDVQLDGTINSDGGFDVTAGVLEGGRLVISWSDNDPGGTARLLYTTSDDGERFAQPTVFREFRESSARPQSASMSTAPGGLGMTWVEVSADWSSPAALLVQAVLQFATLDNDGLASGSVPVSQNDHGLIFPALASGTGRFAIASIGQGEHPTPLFFTLLESDGTVRGERVRLGSASTDGEVGIAWGGNAFAVVSHAPPGTGGKEIQLRQIDAGGVPRHGPLAVSSPLDPATNFVQSAVVPIGTARYFVAWNDSRGPDGGPVINGAVVTCSP